MWVNYFTCLKWSRWRWCRCNNLGQRVNWARRLTHCESWAKTLKAEPRCTVDILWCWRHQFLIVQPESGCVVVFIVINNSSGWTRCWRTGLNEDLKNQMDIWGGIHERQHFSDSIVKLFILRRVVFCSIRQICVKWGGSKASIDITNIGLIINPAYLL